MNGPSTAATAVAPAAPEARLRRAGYRILVVITVFGPIFATFFAIWRLWGDSIGGTELTLFVGLYIATGLGVSAGWHRMLSHGSFACGPVVKGILLVLGTMAGQGRPIEWAAHHRKHHALSDREGDPHSPLDGFVHAYFGWILRGPPAERERYCRRLLEDPLIVFIDRTAAVWVLLGLAIPFAIAGWERPPLGRVRPDGLLQPGRVLGQLVRAQLRVAPFETTDESRNNWILALLAFGDGWHNNHHAFPSMAYHGMRARQFDPSGAT